MKVLVSIDDTDNLDSIGTGDIAEMLAAAVEGNGWGKPSRVTRHQLFIHPDIPYTSHNSAMCFVVEMEKENVDALIKHCGRLLAQESAEGSDPGLCIAKVDELSDRDLLTKFGRKAKNMVLAKEDAYALAERLGVHLSEHGGTGQGIIGALAGAGLRLSGNDGRFKGKLAIEVPNNVATVADICNQVNIDSVRTLEGEELPADVRIKLEDKVKTVLLDNKCILMVCPNDDNSAGIQWQACPMKYLRDY